MPPACRRRPSELAVDVALDPHERFSRGFEWRPHSAPPTECANAKNRVGNAHGGPRRRLSTCAHSNSTICNENVPYTRAQPALTLKHFIRSRTLDVPSTSPSYGTNSGALKEPYSTHTYAFKQSCAIHTERTSLQAMCYIHKFVQPWLQLKLSHISVLRTLTRPRTNHDYGCNCEVERRI